MIRDKTKIYGEVNDPNTVLVPNELVPNKYVISDGERNIKIFNPGAKKLMITNNEGKASSFSYNKPNQLIGVDSTGKLALFQQLPEVPPTGRELIISIVGSYFPSAVLNTKLIDLPGMEWYEIEILGAGGGGGGGIGEVLSDVTFLDGIGGGAGGYYKGLFSLAAPAKATIAVGNGGGGGGGINWVLNWPNYGMNPVGTNYGGSGGRTPLLPITPVSPNDGENTNYSISGNVDNEKLGGLGVNSGAKGGDTFIENVGVDLNDEIKGAGAGGGGGNGPYGGNGGDSIYTNNVGLIDCRSGGGGGAGAGVGLGGNGGHAVDFAPISYGGGGGGGGVVVSSSDYTKSAGGGGGGGASIFQCGNVLIICGGGGGGAGAGYGGTKLITAGQPGSNNKTSVIGGGAFGGTKGKGCNIGNVLPVNCKGANGLPGIIRLWRCI